MTPYPYPLLFLLCVVGIATAAEQPVSDTNGYRVANGGVVRVVVPPETTAAYVADRRVTLLTQPGKNGAQRIALVGVSLYHKPGKLELTLFRNDKNGNPLSLPSVPIEVYKQSYGIDYLTITKKSFTDPTEADLARAKKDGKLVRSLYRTWSDRVPVFPLYYPAKGRVSSTYGKRRFINRVERNPHRGLDIANLRGTPLVAPAPATVVYAGSMFYTGKTVILSHGSSLYTLYAHLDEIAVKEGQELTRLQPLGTIGNTGRVTGPHVHISAYLNQTSVDPEGLFVAMPNTEQ